MKKIGELHRENGSVGIGILIGVIMTGLMIWFSIWILDLNVLMYLQKEKIWEVLLILPTMLTAFIVHEFIHIGFFMLFGKGEARIKVSREKSVGAVIMHQTNEDVYYKRWEMIIILLAPLIILTVLFLFLYTIVAMPFLILANIVLNAMGSSVDLYVSLVLLTKRDSSVFVNFDASTVKMNMYKQA